MLRQDYRASKFRWPVNEVLAFVALALAAYASLSLATYAESDPTWRFATYDAAAVENLGGVAGAVLADLFFLLIGWVAYLVPLALVALCTQLFVFRKKSTGWMIRFANCAGFAMVFLGLCVIAEAHLSAPILNLETQGGGLAGTAVFSLSRELMPIEVSMTLALVSVVVGLELLRGFSWLRVCDWFGRVTKNLCRLVGAMLSRNAISDSVAHPKRVERKPAQSAPEPSRVDAGNLRWNGSGLLARTRAAMGNGDKRRQRTQLASKRRAGKPPKPRGSATSMRVEPSLGPAGGVAKRTSDQVSPTIAKKPEPRVPVLPAVELLDDPQLDIQGVYTERDLEEMAATLTQKLGDFRVEAEVGSIQPGPVVTRFEVQPAPGVKVSKFTSLAKDLARALTVSSVRIVEVIPGRSTVGIEIPNEVREIVHLREIVATSEFAGSESPLTLALGKDVAGQPVLADIGRMPHLLVAGTTGAGKSVGINTVLVSILYKATPEQVKFILIDPKMLELSVYEGIPHLLTPVVTDMQEAGQSLNWCVAEMERRYRLMASLGVRSLDAYNRRVENAKAEGRPVLDPFWMGAEEEDAPALESLPVIVVVIDEFADMMMIVGKKIDQTIARIAQKARAAGIHLVLATQRPSVDVITGLIKANINCRIAFSVPTRIDSRTILDQGGAEQLLGYGDMLYMRPGTSIPERVHGAYVSSEEVHRVVGAWKKKGEPQYLQLSDVWSQTGSSGTDANGDAGNDEHYDEAVAFVLDRGTVSISSVQRKFKIGYNRAANLVEAMEEAGLVSPPGHNGAREVLVSEPA